MNLPPDIMNPIAAKRDPYDDAEWGMDYILETWSLLIHLRIKEALEKAGFIVRRMEKH